MMLIKPDRERRIAIPGVPAPVRRPVDIDQSKTGFASLRTLRIYQFETGSVIDGHAEEDEVFIVVLSGSIELTMSSENWEDNQHTFTLSAATADAGVACAAYLPPHAAYKLTPQTAADVAYARATPVGTRTPKVFSSQKADEGANFNVLLDVPAYAERLRLRLVNIDVRQSDVTISSSDQSQAKLETLIFIQGEVQGQPAERIATIASVGKPPTSVDSWDTIALPPAECRTLTITAETSAQLLIVMSA